MRYGLIGKNLKHSYSKIIHHSLTGDAYELHELPPKDLPLFLTRKDFLGVNVTIPYKEQVLPFLDFIDPKAQRIGSVNTILHKNNQLFGFNTDYDGFVYLLNKHDVEVLGQKVAVLGTGGTSKTVACVMNDLQAKEVILVSRQARDLVISYEQLQGHQDIDIIVNTTPLGMFPENNHQALDASLFPNCKTVIDVIYNPLQTKLLRQADECGKQAIGGLEMLVAQAVYASALFHQTAYAPQVIEQECKKLMAGLISGV